MRSNGPPSDSARARDAQPGGLRAACWHAVNARWGARDCLGRRARTKVCARSVRTHQRVTKTRRRQARTRPGRGADTDAIELSGTLDKRLVNARIGMFP